MGILSGDEFPEFTLVALKLATVLKTDGVAAVIVWRDSIPIYKLTPAWTVLSQQKLVTDTGVGDLAA